MPTLLRFKFKRQKSRQSGGFLFLPRFLSKKRITLFVEAPQSLLIQLSVKRQK
jgi:hypothetical protein